MRWNVQMRLWHKDLIDVLPDKQLVGQWRECCVIAKGRYEGTLNHVLVNKVKDYPEEHLYNYAALIWAEMRHRGMNPRWEIISKYFDHRSLAYSKEEVYPEWHNDRYLRQCYYNLQEKHDCGGITDEEFRKIEIRIIAILTRKSEN